MTTRLKRPAEAVPAPRDREEANGYLARLGEIARVRALIQAALDEEVARRKAQAEAEAAPLAAEAERLTRGLQLWAEANRAALTEGGRIKTVKLPAGEIGWRARPPSVRIARTAEVIAALQRLGLTRFLRIKTEVDKEAMLREPEAARAVPGVSIASGGEDFVVQPAALALAPRPAAATG
ncbi:hypothetical protein GCM10010964_18410 [Caldovatus sediminis]|uniref:Host-nuclease inhibitor protein Gam n=1 Tax=Caldovatus sediminis TaxID=2041189 RepID=A0A8J2ZAI5_9PROT|nr:host-nuclease inhibitor Gam family protein [Caldovatus sediminis]GGG30821.1 hypothetical protein GCM10010964_18410 [Caldovatus sediminis]